VEVEVEVEQNEEQDMQPARQGWDADAMVAEKHRMNGDGSLETRPEEGAPAGPGGGEEPVGQSQPERETKSADRSPKPTSHHEPLIAVLACAADQSPTSTSLVHRQPHTPSTLPVAHPTPDHADANVNANGDDVAISSSVRSDDVSSSVSKTANDHVSGNERKHDDAYDCHSSPGPRPDSANTQSQGQGQHADMSDVNHSNDADVGAMVMKKRKVGSVSNAIDSHHHHHDFDQKHDDKHQRLDEATSTNQGENRMDIDQHQHQHQTQSPNMLQSN